MAKDLLEGKRQPVDLLAKKSQPKDLLAGNVQEPKRNALTRSLSDSRKFGLPTGSFIPQNLEELKDLGKVGLRQLVPDSPGLVGFGASLVDSRNQNTHLPEPNTQYGKNLEMAGNAAQVFHLGNALYDVAKEPIGNLVKYGEMNPTAESLIKKAQKMTTEVLQPPKGELQDYLKQGRQHPAVEQATNYIDEVKDYGQLRRKLGDVVSGKFGERQHIMEQANRPIGREYLRPLLKEINQAKLMSQTRPEELGAMKDVLKSEIKYLRENDMDVFKAQKQKEYLQDLAEKLIDKRDTGESIIREPARHKAIDKLQFGLREAIENVDPRIKPINQIYGGMKGAQELAAGQEALAQKAIPENMLEKFSSIFKKPADIPMAVARRSLANMSDLPGKTRRIAELVKKARSLG